MSVKVCLSVLPLTLSMLGYAPAPLVTSEQVSRCGRWMHVLAAGWESFSEQLNGPFVSRVSRDFDLRSSAQFGFCYAEQVVSVSEESTVP